MGGTTGLTVTIGETTKTITDSYKIESSGQYHFTGTYSGTPTAEIGSSEGTAVISVEAGIAGEVTIILEGVDISLTENQQCPLSARNATGKVTVQLKGTNTLASTYSGDGGQCPALWAPETSGVELIIEKSSGTETGSLTATAEGTQDAPGIGSMSREGSQITIKSGTIEATGGANAAGIGGGYYGDGGTITIEGGTVIAKGGSNGAGIGGGYIGNGGTINITGGTVQEAEGGSSGAGIGGGNGGDGGEITISGEDTKVTATGGAKAAGIGGGEGNGTSNGGGAGGTITISGGTVTATGGPENTSSGTSDGGAGIGGGYGGDGGTITITGGEVTAKGGLDGAAGIGAGERNSDGTITITGGKVTAIDGSNNNGTSGSIFDIKGNTVIVGPDATMVGTLNCSYTNGFVFEENATSAEMKGTATLLADMTIGTDQTLTIPTDASLTIEEKVTLTNNGTITIEDNGTIKNTGTITGTVSGGTVLTKLTESMITITPDTYTYDGSEVKPTVTVKSSDNTVYDEGEDKDYTLDYDNNINAGTATVKVTPTQTGSLYVDEGDAVTKTFTIEKAAPTAAHFQFTASSDLTYNGQEKTATVQANNNITGMGDITINYYNGGTLLSSAPTNAGAYTVKISVTEGTNYTAISDLTADNWTFTIAQATNSWTSALAIADWTYGASANSPSATAAFGEPSFSYAAAENGEYAAAVPTAAGTWWVKASVEATANYTALASALSFTISKATPAILFTVPAEEDLVYDGNAKEATASVSGVADESETLMASLSYEKKTGDDTWEALQDENKPTDVGEYRVTAKFAGTTNYNPAEQAETYTITPANATLSFAQPTLTITLGDAVPTNALTNLHTCPVTYSSSNEAVATVNADGAVTVVGVGTTTIKATAGGNYTGTAFYTLTVNSSIPPYIPPTPDPDPIYYTVTIPTEVAGAIIHGGGTHEVEEYTYCSFRIELDPNGNGEYPTVTKGYWWDTLTPDGQGNYSVYVTGNTQITIGEVPTNSYDYYQVTLQTDSVAEADDQYWSGDYIEVTGASPLRAAEEANLSYQAPFGTTVTLRPIETERRKFLQWEDGNKQKERTLTLRDDQEIKALWQRISPTGIEAIAAGSVIRGERGQLYIEVPEPCDVTLYTYGGVPVRVARLAAGANRLSNLNAGLYLVKLGAAPAVPVRVR